MYYNSTVLAYSMWLTLECNDCLTLMVYYNSTKAKGEGGGGTSNYIFVAIWITMLTAQTG